MRLAPASFPESRSGDGGRCCNSRRRVGYDSQLPERTASPRASLSARNPDLVDDREQGLPDSAADHVLVQAFLRRDREATDALAERLAAVPRFVGCLNRRFGSQLRVDEVADLAQDVIAIALRKLASFPLGAPLEAWLYRIAGFELSNALRRKRGRMTTELPEGLAAAEAGVGEVVERLDLLATAMAQLPPEAAQVVRMHHFDGLTFVEIGAQIAATTNVIKGRYYRAIERLTEILQRRTAANMP